LSEDTKALSVEELDSDVAPDAAKDKNKKWWKF
jgi:hypothetical protein